MTPLEISILLHYYCSTTDFRGGDFSAPAVDDAMRWFAENDLLQPTGSHPNAGPEYAITERGRVYIEALRAVPLPEKRRVMPSSHPGYSVPSLHVPPGPAPDPLTGWRVT